MTETCRMSIADQLEEFQRSEETSRSHSDVLLKPQPVAIDICYSSFLKVHVLIPKVFGY